MVEWLGVAGGGLVGAVTRFFITNRVNERWQRSFPLATFAINVTGAMLLGFTMVAASAPTIADAWWRSTVGLGFCGAYTTFSTYMFEAATLRDRRALRTAAGYVLISLLCGLGGAWLGGRL
jgi:CrcB protein